MAFKRRVECDDKHGDDDCPKHSGAQSLNSKKARRSMSPTSPTTDKSTVNVKESDGMNQYRSNRKGAVQLSDLSDEVLLIIVKDLDHFALASLAETSHRMSRITSDPALWRDVLAHLSASKSTGIPLSRLLKRAPHATVSNLLLRGEVKSPVVAHFQDADDGVAESVHSSISASDISMLSSSQFGSDTPMDDGLPETTLTMPEVKGAGPGMCSLTRLHLDHCYIDASEITIATWPVTLQSLTLCHCQMYKLSEQRSYFMNVEKALPYLHELDLTGCAWLTNHSLMAICKLTRLRRLLLTGCHRVGETIAYTALACRFGFHCLETCDLRDTCISDDTLPCFAMLPSLRELHLGHTATDLVVPKELHCESDGIITDRGLLSCTLSTADAEYGGFGGNGSAIVHQIDGDSPAFVMIRADDQRQSSRAVDAVSPLQQLTVTHMMGVTDVTLNRLGKSALPLKCVDVTGTAVTADGVQLFVNRRPTCQLVCEKHKIDS